MYVSVCLSVCLSVKYRVHSTQSLRMIRSPRIEPASLILLECLSRNPCVYAVLFLSRTYASFIQTRTVMAHPTSTPYGLVPFSSAL